MDPFGKVIASQPKFGMLVIHTSRAELYGRLWCVFEVDVADEAHVTPHAACSMEYMEKFQDDDLEVQAIQATCFSKEDKAMITEKILARDGFEALDETIYGFRAEAMQTMTATTQQLQRWAHSQAGHVRKPWERMMALVRGATHFVGLHCLLTMAEKSASRSEIDPWLHWL